MRKGKYDVQDEECFIWDVRIAVLFFVVFYVENHISNQNCCLLVVFRTKRIVDVKAVSMSILWEWIRRTIDELSGNHHHWMWE